MASIKLELCDKEIRWGEMVAHFTPRDRHDGRHYSELLTTSARLPLGCHYGASVVFICANGRAELP